MHATRAAAVLALLALAAAVAFALPRQQPFPHGQHQGLFPLCEGCHGDMETGDGTPRYPEPATCARCHDGQREDRVAWTARSERPSNLVFTHGEHRDAAARTRESVTCVECHRAEGEGRMAVGPATPPTCTACHAHAAPDHLAPGSECIECHAPLAEAGGLGIDRIAAFPRPVSHDAADFTARHVPDAATATSCAVCHARESCTVCHANAATVPAIAALRPDARVADLVRDAEAVYPTPADHADPAWDLLHGDRAAAAVGSCANCHTRESCATCHAGPGTPALAELPVRTAGAARGVSIAPRAALVHAPAYERRHSTDAVARESTCASCHDRAECESCHVAGSTPAFHLPDFLATHGPAAYAAETECVSCHSTEVFCRACHVDTGSGARDRLGVAFHTANPFWLFGHGVAARQGLETCATCHAQQSCMQCHAATGSWRISPHGPGFDARRAQAANPITCRLCHRAGSIR